MTRLESRVVRPLWFSFPKKMASRQVSPPPKEHCFLFTVPDSTTSVDEIIDSIEEVTGANGVLFLQHLGGFKFLVCVKTSEQATQLLVQGSFKIAENEIQVEAVGTPCVPVNIFRLPPYISHETVAAALQPFGKVRDIFHNHALTARNFQRHTCSQARDDQAGPEFPHNSRLPSHA